MLCIQQIKNSGLQFYKLLKENIPMAKKTIAELLQEAKELKAKELAIKQERKAQQQVLATEYIDSISPEEKQKQIAEAEKILNTAKEKAIVLKTEFKKQLKAIKLDVAFAKEILAFVNYKQNNSLKKQKNSFVVNGNILKFNREGIKEITVDISNANWQKNFKEELRKQGINGDNRIADNIVYKATQLIKSNITI
jgi:hypothetical protein